MYAIEAIIIITLFLCSSVSGVCEVLLPILGVFVGFSAIVIIGLSVALCKCIYCSNSCYGQQSSEDPDTGNPYVTFHCNNREDGGTTSTLKNFSDSRKVLTWLVTVVSTLDKEVAKNNTELRNILKSILTDLTKRRIEVDSVEDNHKGSDEVQKLIEHIKIILDTE